MHSRLRHIEYILQKRAKIFPVLGVLGPRQVGKSTFLMQQWTEQHQAHYLTFDKQETLLRAKRSPEQFLVDETHHQTEPIVIDEAQKVPQIFDSIKALVDEKRRLGMFTLSGSVEFSAKSGVRESLTGRLGITRLYPMTLREISAEKLTLPWVSLDFTHIKSLGPQIVEKWLERGGMPIFCNLSDADERDNMVNSWLETLFYRDLQQFKDGQYDGELALTLLNEIANQHGFLSLNKLAQELGITSLKLKKHLAALEALFLLYELPSFENPRAHSEYRIFDSAVFNTLIGGKTTVFSRQASLVILLINEIYAQYEYAGKLKPKLYHYRTRGGAEIDLILQTKEHLLGIECLTTIDISPYRQRGMKNFLDKYPKALGYFVAPVQTGFQLDKNMFVVPWNAIG